MEMPNSRELEEKEYYLIKPIPEASGAYLVHPLFVEYKRLLLSELPALSMIQTEEDALFYIEEYIGLQS